MAKQSKRPPSAPPASVTGSVAAPRRPRPTPRIRIRDALRGGYEMFAFVVTGLEALLQLFVGRLPRMRPPPPLPPLPAPEADPPADRTVAPYPIMD